MKEAGLDDLRDVNFEAEDFDESKSDEKFLKTPPPDPKNDEKS